MADSVSSARSCDRLLTLQSDHVANATESTLLDLWKMPYGFQRLGSCYT